MLGDSDPRWDDARDRDDESRNIEAHRIELGRGPASDRQSEGAAGALESEGINRNRARDRDTTRKRVRQRQDAGGGRTGLS